VAEQPALLTDPIKEAHRQWTEHGWADAADGMAMVTSVMRVQQILLKRVEDVLRPLGLTFARYEILMLLSFTKSGAMAMKRVGSRLQVHPTSVTSAVDRLEAQGLVERRAHATDRRAVLAAITEAGRSIAADATVVINREVFAQPHLTPAQIKELTRLLGILRSDANDF
jgi:DNA-binding MarR family transcriptional regulator